MKVSLMILGLVLLQACSQNESPIIIADFDSNDYGKWQAEGTAFNDGPGVETMAYLGKAHATSLNSSNETATGTLISAPFTIERNSIHFLLGAREIDYINGTMKNPDDLAVQLLIDGKVERQAFPEQFHGMFHRAWDVAEFKGQQAQIRIVDNDNRAGVFIDVDHIVQNNIPVEGIITERNILVNHNNLNIPVKRAGQRYYFEIFAQGELVRAFECELAVGEIDYWVKTDLSPWSEQQVTVRTRQYFEDKGDILDMLAFADGIIDSEDLYQEELRPQFHFSAQRGWLNDPNGLVYYDGEYHLYYQANPFGWDHSLNDYNKTWGHAVSTDLVHWQELPAVIHPDQLGSIYSGSAVVDHQNTTGFKNGQENPIVAVYTSAGNRNQWSLGKDFTQSIAYSNDRGRTFTKFEGNPVQENMGYINRDPKAFWYEPGKIWVIVLYLDHGEFVFFTSKDLKSWQEQSRLPIQAFAVNEIAAFEDCPELFELPVDADPDKTKWILYAGAGDYVLGAFDGKVFTPQSELIDYNYGDCFYASQTFNNVAKEDGRRIQMAWGWVDHPGMPFNQQMTFPVELTLKKTPDGLRLFAYPVEEIQNLYNKEHTWKDTELHKGQNLLTDVKHNLLDIDLECTPQGATHMGFVINGRKIEYDVKAQLLKSGEQQADLQPIDGKIKLRILVDKLTAEVYANEGSIYMPLKTNPGGPAPVEIYSLGGSTHIRSLTVHELNSIWK